ncbi:MAG TPA: STAS domain-containing protein [Anaerolineales bacterium]|nr:STAS domain-containing protein [Anaerolineales bacterium]
MSITVEFNGNSANIILSGGIDYSKQDEFKKANEQVLSAEGVTEIHVNFAETTFLDSSGIRALLMLQKDADESGKSVILYHVNENMRDIFDIGGFDKVFKFH